MTLAGDAGRSGSRFALEIEDASAGDSAAGRLVSHAVKRAQAGDHEAFAFLYARFAEDVCGCVGGIVRDPREAEHLTRRVFAKLTCVMSDYREGEASFRAWLLRLARDLAQDEARWRRTVPADRVSARLPGSTELSASSRPRRRGNLKEALATLPKDEREVLVLRHISGLSSGEIATFTGRSEESIHRLCDRGRASLRAALIEPATAPVTARP